MSDYKPIRTPAEAEDFLEQCGYLHDGKILSMSYAAAQITVHEDGSIEGELPGDLTMRILAEGAPSMPVVELVFRRCSECGFNGTYLFGSGIDFDFGQPGDILWADAVQPDRESLKSANYAIAREIEWRFMEDSPFVNRV